MADSIEGRVRSAVDAWLRWLPRWRVGSSRARTRVCRLCLGSPVAQAAGFDHEVPHGVQHALLARLQAIVDDEVDDYTAKNLPQIARELRRAESEGAGGYDPHAGLDPEFQGLDVDPEPEPGQPFLFTLSELEGTAAGPDPVDAAAPEQPFELETPPEPALTDEAKAALAREISLADDHARAVGTALCLALVAHRPRIGDAVTRLVEPQVEILLAELSRSLELPRSR
ncbi:spermidine/putrescine ABC transporter substrate-binding protein [Frigoribacterium sp. 2-23]|uniref:spermidine/putrescine ABC transporter substrate-binding protein n=1 Tax=Frigoribacterium sp. 2-23 TaxID=3415006 RepID=UPI003C6EAFFC